MRADSMSGRKDPVNPFYVLLVVVGVTFFITAAAYGVMAFKAANPSAPRADATAGQGLLVFLNQHGATALTVELVLLAGATAAAMVLDQYRSKR